MKTLLIFLQRQCPLIGVSAVIIGIWLCAPDPNRWGLCPLFFHWWQPLTYMWLQGPWWHLLINLYALWLFASAMGPVRGWLQTFSIFCLSGLFAAGGIGLATLGLQSPHICAVGASGAILGVMVWSALDKAELRLIFWFCPQWDFSPLWALGLILIIDGILAWRVELIPVSLAAHAAGSLGGFCGRSLFRCRARGNSINPIQADQGRI